MDARGPHKKAQGRRESGWDQGHGSSVVLFSPVMMDFGLWDGWRAGKHEIQSVEWVWVLGKARGAKGLWIAVTGGEILRFMGILAEITKLVLIG